jgi:leucyl-tRNA synthetase
MPLDITENEIVLLCKNNEKINKSMEWKEIKKVIFVPWKIVNFVL